jgi:hypothetical protein
MAYDAVRRRTTRQISLPAVLALLVFGFLLGRMSKGTASQVRRRVVRVDVTPFLFCTR